MPESTPSAAGGDSPQSNRDRSSSHGGGGSSQSNNGQNGLALDGNGNANSGMNNKPRLTEDEKRANHIASENKRRNAIREQFDRIADMTPGMAGNGKSEGRCLEAMVSYARKQMEEMEVLITQIEAKGVTVSDDYKALLRSPGGGSGKADRNGSVGSIGSAGLMNGQEK